MRNGNGGRRFLRRSEVVQWPARCYLDVRLKASEHRPNREPAAFGSGACARARSLARSYDLSRYGACGKAGRFNSSLSITRLPPHTRLLRSKRDYKR